ncbi:AlpA family transcriptional regulator [Paraburkholderia sediminicola]|uniref:helix-turn-helix transcriptional regulator n=1 Tax=Paraburkholderia sediminicola TaxID=458836 RepID=UPI0038BC3AC2
MSEALVEALIRKRQVLEMTGWSNSTLYQRIADGEFKKGVSIGPRMVAWPLSEVQAYIARRIAERDAKGAVAEAFTENNRIGGVTISEGA